MKLSNFKQLIQSEFGHHLEHATPANVREFLDKYQEKKHHEGISKPIEINESAASYEEIIRDFLVNVLEHPSDESIINLWMLAFELSFAAEEDQYSEMFSGLFKESES